ncbi:hypothetical protein [Nocardia sp. SC052]|uniref:hypothetical protein n=1 Tax=Nocardia sichangensis TaxID=3385975 RepID=UPI00399EE901
MVSLWWSFALTTIGVVGLALVYARPRSVLGPGIGLAVQGLWITYSVSTGQWWFLLSALTYGSVNMYGIHTRRTAHAAPPRDEQATDKPVFAVTLTDLTEIQYRALSDMNTLLHSLVRVDRDRAVFRGSAPGVIADIQQQMDRLRAITGTAYPFRELCSIRDRITAQATTDTEDLL